MVNAAYSPCGLQNVGFSYAIGPALEYLYEPGERLFEARMRYARHHNCHPFFTPMLLGVLLRLESSIAEGTLQPSVLDGIKDITANTLSAIGDSLFNGTLLVCWALFSSCLILADLPRFALLFTLACFVLLQLFKLGTCLLGFNKGMSALFLLRRFDIINLADSVKCMNAVLLAVFMWLSLPEAPVTVQVSAILYILFAAWLVGKGHIPRVLLAVVLLAVTVVLYASGLFEQLFAGEFF